MPSRKGMLRGVKTEENVGRHPGKPSAYADRPAAISNQKAQATLGSFRMPRIPRGVYRFKSHEEADAWLMKMATGIDPGNEIPERRHVPPTTSPSTWLKRVWRWLSKLFSKEN